MILFFVLSQSYFFFWEKLSLLASNFEDCRNDCISRTRTVERYIAREAIERAEFLREISLRTKFGKEINIGAQEWEIVA